MQAMPTEPLPIACLLPLADGARQALEWRQLRQQALSASPIEGGVALEYPVALQPTVEALAQREAACCEFLDFSLTSDATRLRLEVTSTDGAAMPVIELLTGLGA